MVLILNGLRRKLNRLDRWKQYFHEHDEYGYATKSDNAYVKLQQLIKEKAEEYD